MLPDLLLHGYPPPSSVGATVARMVSEELLADYAEARAAFRDDPTLMHQKAVTALADEIHRLRREERLADETRKPISVTSFITAHGDPIRETPDADRYWQQIAALARDGVTEDFRIGRWVR